MYYRNLQSKREKMEKKIVSLMFLKKVNNKLSVLVCTKPHSDEYILPHSTITGPLTISELHHIAKKVGVDSRGILYRSIYESYMEWLQKNGVMVISPTLNDFGTLVFFHVPNASSRLIFSFVARRSSAFNGAFSRVVYLARRIAQPPSPMY